MSSTNGARKGRTTSKHVTTTKSTHGSPAPQSSNKNSDRQKYTKLGLIDPAKYDTIFTEEDKKPVKLKLKGSLAKQTNPGNWSEENVVTGAKGKRGKDKDGSPLMKPLDDKIAAAFPSGKPFEDVQETVNCKHCKRPVLRNAAAQHIKDCLKKKQEKLQKKKEAKEAKDAAIRKEKNGGISPAPEVDDGTDPKRARKTALDIGDGMAKKSGKKRKADDEPKGASAKKKKKEDTKAKAAKAKGPVDVEKQCGVILNNGAMCARSLTCKSHSMGAKRSVPGRSMPYDVLLAQYQKKNQAKQQRKFFCYCY
jgi:SAGA-associated factor 73